MNTKKQCDEKRCDAARVNPLVGQTTTDTIENLQLCLKKMGTTYADRYEDESIGFFCSAVACALDFEIEQLNAQHGILAATTRISSAPG